MMKLRVMLVSLFVSIFYAGIPAQALTSPSLAQPVTQVAACAPGLTNFFGFQPWHACLPKNSDGSPKLTKLTDIYLIAFPVVDWILKAAVYVAAGMIFFMLFKIAMARGNSSTYSTAISGIRDAIIGLVIAMLSVAILNFVSGAFY